MVIPAHAGIQEIIEGGFYLGSRIRGSGKIEACYETIVSEIQHGSIYGQSE